MTPPSTPDETGEKPWLDRLKERVPDINGALERVPAECRPVVYGQVFAAVMNEVIGKGPHGPGLVTTPGRAQPSPPGGGRWLRFLGEHGISADRLTSIVDLESGHVLARNLGGSRAETQRKLAALIALRNAFRTGEFTISREELVEVCKDHAVYDSSNFASNMAGVEFAGSVVFIRTELGYRVSVPGEAYVADVVRNLLGSAGGAP